MFDLIAEIRQTLRSNRLRTFLTGISVAWGVFMLILLLGVARGVTNGFRSNMGSAGSNNLIEVWGGITSKAYRGYSDGRWIQLESTDRDAIVREHHANVPGVYPLASVDSAVVGPRGSRNSFSAIYPESLDDDNGNVFIAGRQINDRDIAERRRSIVLAERNARILFGSSDSVVGRTVTTMGLAWTVVGVYRHNWRSVTYVPYTTYKAITGNNNDVDKLNVRIQDIDNQAAADTLENEVRRTLARTHEFHPDDRSALWVWNSLSNYFSSNAAMGYLTLAVWVIGLFSLLTGIVGVSNIMFVSVRERTHEIGIRRAIGARPASILFQILAEGVAITAIFGYAGVFAGMVILQILDVVFATAREIQNPTVDISIAVEITITLIVAGALAGLFPALKALKVKPVEALRDE